MIPTYMLPWILLTGVVAGVLWQRAYERRKWRRLFEKYAPGPMSTTPPTLAELRTPDWGPNLVDCPMCDGAAMSQAALNEHLRVRHGDS